MRRTISTQKSFELMVKYTTDPRDYSPEDCWPYCRDDVMTIAGVQLTAHEALEICHKNLYIVNFRGIFKPVFYPKSGSFRAYKILDRKGMTLRGRFIVCTADQVRCHLIF